MTTIIGDKRTLTMAGDRQTDDRYLRGFFTKIRKVMVKESSFLQASKHVLVGISGQIQFMELLVKWVEDGMPFDKHPTFDENFSALVLTENKLYQIESQGYPIVIEEPFYAVGSGNTAAMAAMYCGKSPCEAVKIAHKVDVHTGGDVDVLTLLPDIKIQFADIDLSSTLQY